MRSIQAVELLTLDGVMQAPGGRDEDRRGGFDQGGWATPYNDEIMGQEMAKGMGDTELLFGRRTYEILHAAWADRTDPNPFTQVLNDTRKYVASTTLTDPLPWVNSVLLDGDAADALRELKNGPGKDLVILGSGELVRALMAADLVDVYRLLIHPLVLGSGRRLFDDGSALARLQLEDSIITTTGVVITTYKPA
jgi:dihydrofolate reductase